MLHPFLLRAVLSIGQKRACCVTGRSRWNVCPARWTVMLSVDSSGSAILPGLVLRFLLSYCFSGFLVQSINTSSKCMCVIWSFSLRKATWWSVSSSTWVGQDTGKSPPPNAPSSNWSCRLTSGSARGKKERGEPLCTACEYTACFFHLYGFISVRWKRAVCYSVEK